MQPDQTYRKAHSANQQPDVQPTCIVAGGAKDLRKHIHHDGAPLESTLPGGGRWTSSSPKSGSSCKLISESRVTICRSRRDVGRGWLEEEALGVLADPGHGVDSQYGNKGGEEVPFEVPEARIG